MYQLGIESLIHKKVTTLSSGQFKRIQFIDMILSKQNIWLIDEPFNFIDHDAKSFILGKISEHINSYGIIIFTLNE